MDRRVCLPTWKSLHGLGTLAHSSIVVFPLHAVVQDWLIFKHSCFSSTCCGTGLAWYPPFYDYSDQCSSCLMTLLSDCEALEGSTKS